MRRSTGIKSQREGHLTLQRWLLTSGSHTLCTLVRHFRVSSGVVMMVIHGLLSILAYRLPLWCTQFNQIQLYLEEQEASSLPVLVTVSSFLKMRERTGQAARIHLLEPMCALSTLISTNLPRCSLEPTLEFCAVIIAVKTGVVLAPVCQEINRCTRLCGELLITRNSLLPLMMSTCIQVRVGDSVSIG